MDRYPAALSQPLPLPRILVSNYYYYPVPCYLVRIIAIIAMTVYTYLHINFTESQKAEGKFVGCALLDVEGAFDGAQSNILDDRLKNSNVQP
jgi:hypothetical protein